MALEVRDKDRLPLSPHVINNRAKPTASMLDPNKGTPLRFMVLDKRTLKIHRLEAPVGKRVIAPWGGALYPMAFVNDLVIQEGRPGHGPDGYINPAVWVTLEDNNGQPLHEGWLFERDSAQTAWDHPRFDLTFLGKVEPPAPAPTPGKGAQAAGAAARKRIPSTPASSLPEPQDEAMEGPELRD
ncbi:hypothetical protein [Candidatus Magnetaquicoccus inordinatus]|uniref:hypothetical protein n=1 Tax=Candidatus Magnetaquicoccus inordinatus TaxID=2496818 RepID=UPI00102C1F6A|nr:hypothetical protein [Candidatus Magnetaquicoccus inordinatus]